jgi:hypothetical protein
MSQGFLIFAFNNGTFDYVKQAFWLADRISHFLNKPVTIVSDEESIKGKHTNHNIILTVTDSYSNRSFQQADNKNVSRWFNGNRYQAYELSPYDETIIVDSDYVICSDQLNLLFDQGNDFLTHRFVLDAAFKKSFDAFETFGQLQMPHYWATVLFFRKSQYAKNIFDLVSMIRNNYKYYSELYKFPSTPYRNDHAVSIAQIIANGHRIESVPTIAWSLLTLPYDATVTPINDVTFDISYEKWNRNRMMPLRNRISGVDFHCMNKFVLEEIIDADKR